MAGIYLDTSFAHFVSAETKGELLSNVPNGRYDKTPLTSALLSKTASLPMALAKSNMYTNLGTALSVQLVMECLRLHFR